MHIDQVQLENEKTEKWRFCPSCQHAILENDTTVSSACPECGDPQWRSNGQERNALKVKTVYAWADLRKDRIVDNIEERRPLQRPGTSASAASARRPNAMCSPTRAFPAVSASSTSRP